METDEGIAVSDSNVEPAANNKNSGFSAAQLNAGCCKSDGGGGGEFGDTRIAGSDPREKEGTTAGEVRSKSERRPTPLLSRVLRLSYEPFSPLKYLAAPT